MSMHKVEKERLARELICEVWKPIPRKWKHVKWLYKLLVSFCLSTFACDLLVMETCALALNTFGHWNSSHSMFLTMLCCRVAASMLVTSRTCNLWFGLHPFTFVAWDNFESFFLLQTLHVHVHWTWLCKLFYWETRDLEHFTLLPPSDMST